MRAILGTRRWCGTMMAALLLSVSGCAAGAAGAGAGGDGAVAVEVENNLIPPTSLSVYAVPETGARRLIGVVEPSATKTLRFDPVAAVGQYVFVAETTGGQEIASNPVVISPPAVVNWDVSANIATVTD